MDDKERDKITIELDSVDCFVLSDAIAERVKELGKEESLFSMCKSIVLQAIVEKIAKQVSSKADQERSKQEMIIQALKRESEKQ